MVKKTTIRRPDHLPVFEIESGRRVDYKPLRRSVVHHECEIPAGRRSKNKVRRAGSSLEIDNSVGRRTNQTRAKSNACLKPEARMARSRKPKAGEVDALSETVAPTGLICRQIMEVNRAHHRIDRIRIKIEQQLRSFIVSELVRSKAFDFEGANKVAPGVLASYRKNKVDTKFSAVIAAIGNVLSMSIPSLGDFEGHEKTFRKSLASLAVSLPAWPFCKDIRGIGEVSFAQVIGETGDLANYPHYRCVWKRLGLAPHNGKMPSTWRSGREGSLSKDEWSDLGYNPHRRCVAYLIGDNLCKQNKGKYRKCYDDQKASFAEKHPDYPRDRCHKHGMLMATKLFIMDLWKHWNNK